ncbi:hypothetical protein L1987_29593 [Smallanthus sonchifolius]|uniref:Uncharacterized protein n=1 Tax=Smallanthus sonchifolius TaxID=185202 RepID=A0ACB9HZU6_9ASTR|nr:hypothetical protein L1987_29593 [Smallanthus sonchifolius]
MVGREIMPLIAEAVTLKKKKKKKGVRVGRESMPLIVEVSGHLEKVFGMHPIELGVLRGGVGVVVVVGVMAPRLCLIGKPRGHNADRYRITITYLSSSVNFHPATTHLRRTGVAAPANHHFHPLI